jgi:glc operon protein GlcG
MNGLQRSLALATLAATTALPHGGGTAAATGPGVTYLPAAQVTAGFSHGAVLVDGGRYMVHASRRDGAGQAEVHALDTDIIYVLEGTATLVTGGTVVGGKGTTPDEVRGSSIAGGETRSLAKGDVVVVPNGTPHWFREVQPPFLYYVVKVR